MRFAKLLLKNEQLFPLLERLIEEAVTGKDLGVSYLDSNVLYGSLEEEVMLIAEAVDFFYQEFYEDFSLTSCVVLQACEACDKRPGRVRHTKFFGRACLLPLVHGSEISGDAWSVEVYEDHISEQHAPL